MALPVWTLLYRRFGARYPGFFLTLELQTAFLLTAGTLGVFTFFYNAPAADYLRTLIVVEALTVIAVVKTLRRTYPRLGPIREWIGGERDEDSTARAWVAAVNLPIHLVRADIMIPTAVVVIPGCIAATAILGLAWFNFFALFVGSMIAMSYSGILHYLALEAGMRPVLVDINQAVSPRLVTAVDSVSLRTRMLTVLPAINVVCGFIVAGLTSHGGGISASVLIAVGIAGAVSLEVTLLLTRSILAPIDDLQRATASVARGEYDVAVPVTTTDELGDLAASFNTMVTGLREREQIREAFGTYLDRSVANILLSGNFPQGGVELDVTILFFDVRDFTHFAADAEAREVIARLNALFETTVPVINRHGGHVDKFMGDGLMAVFGAPENYPDHAERGVRAAIEIADAVHRSEGVGFQIGVGVNTGRVIAGSIGGGGRLNFSVIGDAVNVASRVEAATRHTDDDVLVTQETAEQLPPAINAESRGIHELKGIDRTVELFAVSIGEPIGLIPGEEPLPVPDEVPQEFGSRAAGGLAQL